MQFTSFAIRFSTLEKIKAAEPQPSPDCGEAKTNVAPALENSLVLLLPKEASSGAGGICRALPKVGAIS